MINFKLEAVAAIQQLNATNKNMLGKIANGINKTALQVQEEQRTELGKHFNLKSSKSKRFLENQVLIIKPFARATPTPSAMVQTGIKDRLLLSMFEDGGQQTPRNAKNVAVPLIGTNKAREDASSPVKPSLYISKLDLQVINGQIKTAATRTTKKGKVVKNTKKYFLIPNVGIFRRIGNKVVKLYSFKKQVKIKKLLKWKETTLRVVDKNLAKNVWDSIFKQ